jgi:hypothetical protein
LQTLATALSLPITTFFRGFEARQAPVHTKSGEGIAIEEAGSQAGHQTRLLGHINAPSSGIIAKPYLVTLRAEADIFPSLATRRHRDNLHAGRRNGLSTWRHAVPADRRRQLTI